MHKFEPERNEVRKHVQQFKQSAMQQKHANLETLTLAARDCNVVVQGAMQGASSEALKRVGRQSRTKVLRFPRLFICLTVRSVQASHNLRWA